MAQAPAVAAVLVLAWLLFAGLAMTVPSPSITVMQDVPYTVAVTTGPGNLEKVDDGRWRANAVEGWTETGLPRNHFPAFPIEFAAGATTEFYPKATTTSVVLTPIYVCSAETRTKLNLRDQLFFAALFGAMVS